MLTSSTSMSIREAMLSSTSGFLNNHTSKLDKSEIHDTTGKESDIILRL